MRKNDEKDWAKLGDEKDICRTGGKSSETGSL